MSDRLNFEYGNAICYSGYREGQCPGQAYPTYEQIHEDLLILAKHWDYLRLYDCTPHAETVLEVIRKEGLNFRVMLGMDTAAEMSNPTVHGEPNSATKSSQPTGNVTMTKLSGQSRCRINIETLFFPYRLVTNPRSSGPITWSVSTVLSSK